MQDIVFYVSASEMLGVVRDYANSCCAAIPPLVIGVPCALRMRLFKNADGDEPYPIEHLLAAASWSWVMDSDFDGATACKLQADAGQISFSTVTETVCGASRTYTQCSIPLSAMNTQQLAAWLGTAERKTGLHGELNGFDAQGNVIFALQVKNFTVRNRIPSIGDPTEIEPKYLTAAQVRALINAGFELQFSSDGADWHSTQAALDTLFRFRLSGDQSAPWSGAIALPDALVYQDIAAAATAAKNAAIVAQGAAENSATHAAESAETALAAAHIPPPKCTDMGVVLGTTTISITWGDPEDLEIDGWQVSKWQRTVAVMKHGSYPLDVEDGVIVAATSRYPSADTFPLPSGVAYGYKDAYKLQTIVIPVEDSDNACIKLFSCAANGAWNALAANEYPSYTAYSWAQLAEYADAGTFTSHIPLGSLIDAEDTDLPNMQWMVADTDCFNTENPAIPHHVGLVCYRIPFTAPCDAPETQWAPTEDAAAVTGIVYGINVGGSITQLAEGTDWQAGDTSCIYNGTSYPISEWYEKNPNTNYNYGSNYTPQRNDVQWMNAEGAGGTWFRKQNLWDACNGDLASRPGFLHGLPAVFRNFMLPCKRMAYVYTSFRRRGIGKSVQFTARAFPLSMYELFGTATDGIAEGRKQLSVFGSNSDRIAYLEDGTNASSWWSASAITSNASNAYFVTTAGASSIYSAYNANGYRPACAFGKQVNQ